MKLLLEVEQGANQGKTFEFARPDVFLVGRATDAHLVINPEDTSVSRRHCLVEIAPPRCYLRDLGSRNGTQVNGRSVQYTEVRHNDLIKIGRTVLRVIVCDADSPDDVCMICGRADRRAVQDSVCSDCREESVKPVQAEAAGSPAAFPVPCVDCGVDVRSIANADGLARVYQAEALYACAGCARKRFALSYEKQYGHYRLLSQLGMGGMGVVFLAQDERTGRLGALKTISLPFPDELSVRRFLRETRVMAHLTHSNIVRMFRQGIDHGVPYLFTEYLDGGSISDKMRSVGGKLPIDVACRWTCDMLAGLAHFHESGFVHRDIKPANILLKKSPYGQTEIAKLADFGLAKSLTAAGATVLTQPNDTCGSIQYTAPEQILSYISAGPAADIYSMGISLYQMVTGVLPFAQAMKTATSKKDILLILLEESPPPVNQLNPEVPAALTAIINQAIQKTPAYRYHSAQEFQEALESFLPERSPAA